MVLRMYWIIEQDQGFIMNHSLSNHTPTIYRNSLLKIRLSLTHLDVALLGPCLDVPTSEGKIDEFRAILV